MNFIESYQIEDSSLCDKIIEHFEQRKDLQRPGSSGTEGEIKLDTKVSTDVTFEDKHLTREYSNYLNKFIEEYKKKYIYSDEGQDPWSIYPGVNIQRYNPGEYYIKLHCEHNGARGPTGKRHLVFMTYLNDVNDGGETFFYYQDLYVKPRKGLTLIWPAGWTHTHSGIVSNSETKYIVTGWLSYEPHRPFLIIN
jgi:hypothetical protein